MIKYFIFLSFFVNNVFANDNIFNNINSPEINYIFWIDKSNYSLKILDIKNKVEIKKIKMAFGKNDGDKLKEGDQRTPEGIYRLTKIMSKKYLERYYGKKNVKRYGSGALVLNYPNRFDLSMGKTGSGIWIHGIDNDKKIENKRISKGCVVVTNNDLLYLSKFVKKKGLNNIRVVIVSQNKELKNKKKKTIQVEKYYTKILSNRADKYFKYNEKEKFVGKADVQD
jgi:murein L,D-transpeptidase YafK